MLTAYPKSASAPAVIDEKMYSGPGPASVDIISNMSGG